MAPAHLEHTSIVGYISAPMVLHVRNRRLGNVHVGDPGFHLEHDRDTVPAPDIAFVRAERIPELATSGFPKSFPDLAIEVLSPSNSPAEVSRRIEIYLDRGVTAVWIVDPIGRRAEIHREGQVLRLGLDDVLEDADLLSGLRIPLSDLFPGD